jgi:hypothetical protein
MNFSGVMTRSRAKKQRLYLGNNSTIPVCLGCNATKQGRACDCAETFVKKDLHSLATAAELTYVNELNQHLNELGHMRKTCAMLKQLD